MSRLYPTCADHINQRRYEVFFPSNYDPSPKVVNDPDRGLFYSIHEDPDPDAMIYGRIPIAEFVQMRFLDVPFQFVNQKDVLEVYHVCMDYLEEIQNLIETDTDVQSYMGHKFLPFLSEMEEAGRRILNFNPEWKNVYMQKDNGIFSLIHELLRAKGEAFSNEDPMTKVANAHPLTSPAQTHPNSISLPEKLHQMQNNQENEESSTPQTEDASLISIYGTPKT